MVHNMVHDLQKNTVVVQVFFFFFGAHVHQKSTRRTKYCAPKFQILQALTIVGQNGKF